MSKLILIICCVACWSAASYAGDRGSQAGAAGVIGNHDWIGPADELLQLRHDTALMAMNWSYERLPYTVAGDYLLLKEMIYRHDAPLYAQYDSFRIDRYGPDTLVLTAVNEGAYRCFATDVFNKTHHTSPVMFVRRGKATARRISFEKVIRASGGGMAIGACVMAETEADSAGNFYFSCIRQRGNYSGTYRGKLSAEQLRQLEALVAASIPERFTVVPDHAADAGARRLQVWYNYTMSEAEGRGMPVIAQPLEMFLDNLPGQLQLTKISDAFGVPR